MTDTYTAMDYQRARQEIECYILLDNGKSTLVSLSDYKYLMQWKWTCSYNGYAWRRESLGYKDGVRKRRIIFMHRLIMNTPKDKCTDHINGEKLDNRRCNLRICTNSQNLRNMCSKKGTSKHKGVYWDKINKKWVSQIVINKKPKFLGRFSNEDDAARTYNVAAKKHFGEFARLNFL